MLNGGVFGRTETVCNTYVCKKMMAKMMEHEMLFITWQ